MKSGNLLNTIVTGHTFFRHFASFCLMRQLGIINDQSLLHKLLVQPHIFLTWLLRCHLLIVLLLPFFPFVGRIICRSRRRDANEC